MSTTVCTIEKDEFRGHQDVSGNYIRGMARSYFGGLILNYINSSDIPIVKVILEISEAKVTIHQVMVKGDGYQYNDFDQHDSLAKYARQNVAEAYRQADVAKEQAALRRQSSSRRRKLREEGKQLLESVESDREQHDNFRELVAEQRAKSGRSKRK